MLYHHKHEVMKHEGGPSNGSCTAGQELALFVLNLNVKLQSRRCPLALAVSGEYPCAAAAAAGLGCGSFFLVSLGCSCRPRLRNCWAPQAQCLTGAMQHCTGGTKSTVLHRHRRHWHVSMPCRAAAGRTRSSILSQSLMNWLVIVPKLCAAAHMACCCSQDTLDVVGTARCSPTAGTYGCQHLYVDVAYCSVQHGGVTVTFTEQGR